MAARRMYGSKKILLTGFEPFGGCSENASWVVTEEVATRGVVGVGIALEQLPVSFLRVGKALCDERPTMQAVFVHLPLLEGQTHGERVGAMSREAMVKAIQTIIEEIYD